MWKLEIFKMIEVFGKKKLLIMSLTISFGMENHKSYFQSGKTT